MKPEHELQSEDEEAPEEVTFQSARSRAQETARTQRLEAKREKELLKEKRKFKEEQFKEQKKRKLLSEDILKTVAALPQKREEQTKDASQEGDGNKDHNKKGSIKKKVQPKTRLEDNYDVTCLEDYKLMSLQQEKAKAFIQKRLYGRYKNRTTANEFLSIASKKAAIKKPAFQFTVTTWGEEEKKKAKKFNLIWAHRKKL